MNKLPNVLLPAPNAGMNEYQRLLSVKLDEILKLHRATINKLIQNPDLPEYANNAAAIAGGLVEGQFYRTATGAVYVVY